MFVPRCFTLLAAVCVAITRASLLVKGPESTQAAVGDDVLFACVSAMGTVGYQWEVNGAVVSVGNANYTITKDVASHAASSTSLTIHTGRGNFNQTQLRCIIFNESLEMEYSPSASLLLQGLLAAPVNVSSSQTNCSIVIVSWSAPFSLPSVPIQGYVLNVTNVTAGSQLHDSVLVSGTEDLSWIVHVSSDLHCPQACSQFVASVAAINTVGQGEAIDITFFPVQAPLSSEASYDLGYASPSDLVLHVTAEIATSCLGAGSILAWLDASCDISGNSSISQDHIINLSQPSMTASVVISIHGFPENNKCQAKLSLSNIAGVTTSEQKNFSSYDVQAISLSSAGGLDTFTSCHFLENSSAKGCLLEFTCTQTGLKHSVQIERTPPTDLIGTVIVASLEPCSYRIAVFDVEADGNVSHFPAIVDTLLVAEIPDILLQTTSPSTRVSSESSVDLVVWMAICIPFVVLLLMVAVTGVCASILWRKCHKGNGAVEMGDNVAYDFITSPVSMKNAAVETRDNLAYDSVKAPVLTKNDVLVGDNPAYEPIPAHQTIISACNNAYRNCSTDDTVAEEVEHPHHQYEDIESSLHQYATIH